MPSPKIPQQYPIESLDYINVVGKGDELSTKIPPSPTYCQLSKWFFHPGPLHLGGILGLLLTNGRDAHHFRVKMQASGVSPPSLSHLLDSEDS